MASKLGRSSVIYSVFRPDFPHVAALTGAVVAHAWQPSVGKYLDFVLGHLLIAPPPPSFVSFTKPVQHTCLVRCITSGFSSVIPRRCHQWLGPVATSTLQAGFPSAKLSNAEVQLKGEKGLDHVLVVGRREGRSKTEPVCTERCG